MIKIDIRCDACEGGIGEGSDCYCKECYESREEEIEDLEQEVAELKAETTRLEGRITSIEGPR